MRQAVGRQLQDKGVGCIRTGARQQRGAEQRRRKAARIEEEDREKARRGKKRGRDERKNGYARRAADKRQAKIQDAPLPRRSDARRHHGGDGAAEADAEREERPPRKAEARKQRIAEERRARGEPAVFKYRQTEKQERDLRQKAEHTEHTRAHTVQQKGGEHRLHRKVRTAYRERRADAGIEQRVKSRFQPGAGTAERQKQHGGNQ